MRSNCTECGSSLTIKEAIQDRCSHCNRSLSKNTIHPQDVKGTDIPSLVGKQFDLQIVRELKKKNLLSLAE